MPFNFHAAMGEPQLSLGEKTPKISQTLLILILFGQLNSYIILRDDRQGQIYNIAQDRESIGEM